ncbi:MAG: response regulator [bacterium]
MADQPTPAKILLVEDDRILQELYLDRFIGAGFNVVQAFDGQQALDQLAAHPDTQLILLDIMIPKISGYDVLSMVKADPATKHIPVIIVSALGDIDDQAKGLQLGASDYITKGGILPGAVVEKIKQYVLSLPGPAQQ